MNRPLATAWTISLAMHATVLVFVPAIVQRQKEPLASTVVVELLEKTPGETETTLQASPEGEGLKPAEVAERVDEAPKAEAERSAVTGRAAGAEAKPEPVRPPVKYKPDSVAMENIPEKLEKIPDSVPDEAPDPVIGKTIEATMRLENPDRRYQGFLGKVRSAVNDQWNSRDAMISAGRSGVSTLGFTLLSQGGRAAKVEILGTSKSGALDSEAMRAVSAARFPPFPTNWKLEKLHLTAQFVYSFDSGE